MAIVLMLVNLFQCFTVFTGHSSVKECLLCQSKPGHNQGEQEKRGAYFIKI